MNTKEFRSRGWLTTEPKKQTPIHKRWLGAIAALLLPFAIVTAPAALAASGPWDIDGTVPDSTAMVPLTDPSGSQKELGPINSSATKIGVINRALPPMLGLTNPNGQVDLKQAWLETQRDETTGDVWL